MSLGAAITDEKLLKQLNANDEEMPDEGETPKKRKLGDAVTDENLLKQLNEEEKPEQKSFAEKIMGKLPELMNPLRTVNDVAMGLGKAGQGVASTLTGGYAPTVNFDEVSANKNPNTRDKLIQGLAQYAPFGMAGGASLLGQIGAGLGYGATQTSPNEENAGGYLPKGKVGGALESALINALTHGAFRGVEALRPSNILRGNLSPEQLQANIEATKGTTTGLGDVIGSPSIKQTLENEISDMPFSGTKKTMQGTVKQIQEQADKIASDLKLDEVNKLDLNNALKDASEKARNEKDAKFTKVNNEADKLGIKVGRDNFSEVAQNELNEIEASPELKEELPKDFVSSLKRYAENKEGNTLKRTDIFRGLLGDKANEYFRAGKDNLASVMGKLKKALIEDRESAIANSGHPTLKAMNDEAHTFYKENYAPFKHPDIKKFTREGGDSDLLLPHFLRKGANDRSVLLSRLTDQLNKGSNQDQNLPLRLYLSRAIEGNKTEPKSLAKLYNDLGENQAKVLIPDQKIRNRLENFSNLVRLNTEPLDLMRNPKTGFRGVQNAIHTLLGIGGYGVGGPLGAAIGIAMPGIAMRPVVKALTNEQLRENLVRKMIENKPMINTPRNVQGTQSLLQSLAQTLGQ